MLTKAMLIVLMIKNPSIDTLLEPIKDSSFGALRNPPQVCLSNCEAKYHTMSECVQEIKFAKNLLKDLELPSNDIIFIWVDSKPTIAIVEIPKVTQSNKHFNVHNHFI